MLGTEYGRWPTVTMHTVCKSDISNLKKQLGTFQVKHPRISSATGQAKLTATFS